MNSEKNKVDYTTLLGYFEDKAAAEKADGVQQWLEDPENSFKTEHLLHHLWNGLDSETEETAIDLDTLLDKIHHSINLKLKNEAASRSLASVATKGRSIKLILRDMGRVAAFALVLVLCYIGWDIYSQKMWLSKQSEIVYNEIKCPMGAQSAFELPDGTKGNLNNGSLLKYPTRFTGKTREVELYGEAFFEVAKNKQIPFIISTVGLDIKVLGTKLNVYSYPGENYQEITLKSGSIELIKREEDKELTIGEMKPGQHAKYSFGTDERGLPALEKGKELILIDSKEKKSKKIPEIRPGQEALYRIEGGDLFMKYDKTDIYTGWTDGKLILRNDPMPVLLKRMERWYSVKFNIMDRRINDYTYWATFEEENLDQVLRLLTFTGPVKFNKLPREKKADGTFNIQEIEVAIK
jgi:transmembrane sensor